MSDLLNTLGTYQFPNGWPVTGKMPSDGDLRLMKICERISEGEQVSKAEWMDAQMFAPKSQWDTYLRAREKSIIGRENFESALAELRDEASGVRARDNLRDRYGFLSDEDFFHLEGNAVAPIVSRDEIEPAEFGIRRQIARVMNGLRRFTMLVRLKLRKMTKS